VVCFLCFLEHSWYDKKKGLDVVLTSLPFTGFNVWFSSQKNLQVLRDLALMQIQTRDYPGYFVSLRYAFRVFLFFEVILVLSPELVLPFCVCLVSFVWAC